MAEMTLPMYVEENRARTLASALTWAEDGDGTPQPAGDVGGDAQLDGAALSRAWWAELPNGLHARIEIAFFIGRAPERLQSDLPAEELTSLHQHAEYLICADRSDPGGTEVNAEYVHDDDVRPDLRPTEANVRDLCQALDTEFVAWSDEDRVLRLLALGTPPVDKGTRVVTATSSTRWLFIGHVPIGSITDVEVPGVEDLWLAYGHDWNGGTIPIATPSGKPGEDYEPGLIEVCNDWGHAVRVIVERVPPRLSRHIYEAPEVQNT
jgi:hypothetical protein